MKLFNYFNKKETIQIKSFTKGKVIRLENIPDQAFSCRFIGDGLALEIDALNIYAPCDGIIETIATTRHAFTLSLKNGAHLLVHIGLYQDKPYSQYFHYHVHTGDKVTENTHVLSIDQELLDINHGHLIVPIVILNYKEHPIKTFTAASYAKQGKTLFTIS